MWNFVQARESVSLISISDEKCYLCWRRAWEAVVLDTFWRMHSNLQRIPSLTPTRQPPSRTLQRTIPSANPTGLVDRNQSEHFTDIFYYLLHPTGRELTSDWVRNNFIKAVYENISQIFSFQSMNEKKFSLRTIVKLFTNQSEVSPLPVGFTYYM